MGGSPVHAPPPCLDNPSGVTVGGDLAPRIRQPSPCKHRAPERQSSRNDYKASRLIREYLAAESDETLPPISRCCQFGDTDAPHPDNLHQRNLIRTPNKTAP